MAKRRDLRPTYTPKPREVALNVKIWGDRFAADTETFSRTLESFAELFRAYGFQVEKASEATISGSAESMKLTIKIAGYTKASFFESLRRMWCTSLCRSGSPFWLESLEVPKDSFRYKSDATIQRLQPTFFSLGSFEHRGVYVKHWSSEDDDFLIEDETLQVEFEHDTKNLYITFEKNGEPEGFKEIRLETEFKQLENYLLVDEAVTQGRIDFYLPLQIPLKVFQEVTVNDYHNHDRLTNFLRCSRQVLGSCSVLCLRFRLLPEGGDKTPLELMSRLSRGGFGLYFAAMKTRKPRVPTEEPAKPVFFNFGVKYALDCFLSRGYKVSDRVSRKFYDLLREATDRYRALQGGSPLPPDRVRKALYQLISLVEMDRFCPLEHYLRKLLYGEMMNLTLEEFELPKHYVYVPRLIITPTQNYLVPPELVAENRVIREYGHEDTMRIAFRDEDFSKLASTYPEGLKYVLSERVVDLLSSDIEIGGRRFEFLACSNSQLRDHGAWLFAVDGEHKASDIRESLGKLEGIRCVATYVSRMGQCFSSTKETVTVNIDTGCKVEEIEDIQISYRDKFFECCNSLRSGTYTFSDGVGKISFALAKKVSESLDLTSTPSAYQIRYGGCKGMLAVDPSLPGGERREVLQYRRSMKKFESQHEALEICETTKPNLLYLNRQCILLLSGLGVPDESFIELQDKMLRYLASMLLFETVALETLRRANIPGGLKIMALSRSGISVTREPFFRSLLLAMYKSRLGDLLRRARIAIPESHGRLLMGVIDETGTLEYGQVFVRYSKLVSEPGEDLITLKQKVVISKNPCFHPGDMRTFDAVDVEALHHLVDCVVFPAKGPRPHTDEMSGSDLDGDKYFVTWYDKLLPRRENVEPMDFTSPEKINLDRPIEVSDMIQFVAAYLKNDQLGIIANAHLVHADSEDEGIFSKACIDLAHMHSDAVDFPKTGKCPSLPRELRPDQYPDFMMKAGKPRYISQGILGQLFRKCKSLDRAQGFSADVPQTQVSVDKDMIVPGYEQFLDEAKSIRDRYNTKLETLMSLYGLRNEGEVVSGCLVRVNARLSGKTDEKFEVAQMIQASLSTLRTNIRQEFYEEFGGEEEVMEDFEENRTYPSDVMRKASAWYMVTYQDDTADPEDREESSTTEQIEKTGNKMKLISFPWVVDGILAKIKQEKQNERERRGIQKQHVLNEVGDLITDQAAFYFGKFQSVLVEDRNLRTEEKSNLQSIMARHLRVGHQAPRLSLCGASLTGISVGEESEQTPPTEIYVHYNWDSTVYQQRGFLQQLNHFLRQEGDGRLTYSSELIFKRSQRRLVTQEFRITADPCKMLKSAYLAVHIQRCPRLLHLLLAVMHWGRRRHLNGKFTKSFLQNEELAMLFVVFCEQSDFIDKVDQRELLDYSSCLLGIKSAAEQDQVEKNWNRLVLGDVSQGRLKGFKDNVTPGHALVKFFERYSTSGTDDPLSLLLVKNPVSSRDEKLLAHVTREENVRFSDAALHALHELGQCCGLDSIMTSSNESTRELQETLNMPNTTWGALRFAEEFVAAKLSTLTEAQIFIRPAQRSAGYVLEATGNYLTLHGVQKELEKLENTCRSFVYDHTVSGAPHFLFLNQTSEGRTVSFKKLQRDYVVHMVSSPHGLDFSTDDVAEEKFVRKLSSQLETFQREYLCYMHGSDTLRMKAEFGSIYVENANTLPDTVSEVERKLTESADPRQQSSQAKKKHNQLSMKHKFMTLHGQGGGWMAAFTSIEVDSTKETYTLGVKSGNKAHQVLIVVYDSNFNFCDVEIPPITWYVVDVKAPRPNSTKSRDIDFRIAVLSQRNLEGDEKERVMKSATYEKFSSKPVIMKSANGSLELAREFQSKMAFVRHDNTTIYRVQFKDSQLFFQVKTSQKYNVKNARVLTNPKIFTELQLWADFNGRRIDEATSVAKNIWAATKQLRPNISH